MAVERMGRRVAVLAYRAAEARLHEQLQVDGAAEQFPHHTYTMLDSE